MIAMFSNAIPNNTNFFRWEYFSKKYSGCKTESGDDENSAYSSIFANPQQSLENFPFLSTVEKNLFYEIFPFHFCFSPSVSCRHDYVFEVSRWYRYEYFAFLEGMNPPHTLGSRCLATAEKISLFTRKTIQK